MDKLVIYSTAVAYHYMIHSFKVNHNAKFSDNNLKVFVEDFEEYANQIGFEFVDENGKKINHDDIYFDILENYVKHGKDIYGESFSYFSADCIENMRRAYQVAGFDYHQLVYRFEEMLVRELYQKSGNYLMFEKYYKQDAERYKNNDDKIFQA